MKLNEMTDEELAMSYVGGNNMAFDLLLARNQSNLFSYILFTLFWSSIYPYMNVDLNEHAVMLAFFLIIVPTTIFIVKIKNSNKHKRS